MNEPDDSLGQSESRPARESVSPRHRPKASKLELPPLPQPTWPLVMIVAVMLGATLAARHRRPIRLEDQAISVAAYRVDVNHAEAWELACLPSVGPAMADRIISERERGGPFRGPDDLKRVRGIGEATVAQLEPLVGFGH